MPETQNWTRSSGTANSPRDNSYRSKKTYLDFQMSKSEVWSRTLVTTHSLFGWNISKAFTDVRKNSLCLLFMAVSPQIKTPPNQEITTACVSNIRYIFRLPQMLACFAEHTLIWTLMRKSGAGTEMQPVQLHLSWKEFLSSHQGLLRTILTF